MLKNPNYNYKLATKIFDLKRDESDSILDTVMHLFEIFHMIYYSKTKKHVYFLGKELKFTNEVDPSNYLSLKFAVGTIQRITIDLPLIRNGDTIMINGNLYNPMLQMMDRPLIIKKKNNSIVFMSCIGNIYSSPIVDNQIIRVLLSINKKFNPPILLWFLGFIGIDGFEEMTGAKLIIDENDYNQPLIDYLKAGKMSFNKSNIKPEYVDYKFDILLNQVQFISEEIEKDIFVGKLDGLFARDLLNKNRRGWQAILAVYDGVRILSKIAIHQMLIPRIDIFSANFMKYNDVVKEILRAFSKEINANDIKDINCKRFRIYEMLLLTTMKHLYNLSMNCMYNKITTVGKEKRLRIYDNAKNNNLISYDSPRNNSIMRLSERSRLSQTGDGGYTADLFIGSARDLHESQYGTICPINTPDREKCGVTLYLSPSNISKFESMYYWPKQSEHKDMRLPLKDEAAYKEFMESEEVRLEKEREAKAKEEEKKAKAVTEAIKTMMA